MKMRRRTGVNGVRENHRDTVVNQGGTAESFGPLSGRKARVFYEKIQGAQSISSSCRYFHGTPPLIPIDLVMFFIVIPLFSYHVNMFNIFS